MFVSAFIISKIKIIVIVYIDVFLKHKILFADGTAAKFWVLTKILENVYDLHYVKTITYSLIVVKPFTATPETSLIATGKSLINKFKTK